MIKLTIGIPTFNSYSYLKESIDKILNQIRLLDDVELLICDNASDDGTQILIEEYVQNFPNIIRYIRHPVNLGMDRNFWSVIKNAKGEFVHLLGDDDFYTENGVKRILDVIELPALDAILLSNNYLNTRNGKIIRNKESITGNVICQTGEEFFLQENLKMLVLSNVVVRRSLCLELTGIEKYFGCQWLHVALLTQIIKPTSKGYIFNYQEPVVTVRIGNQRWLEKDGAITYFYKLLRVFESLKNAGYEGHVFRNIKNIVLHTVLDARRIKFDRTYMNLFYCLKFFRFYYDMPKQYLRFCIKLVVLKRPLFFDGWENVGN